MTFRVRGCSLFLGVLFAFRAAQPYPDSSSPPSSALFATAIGVHRRIELEDGSAIELNTDSTLSIYFSRHQRLVYLQKGEAIFHVAHNSERPFRVLAGDQVIQALGTRFDVYYRRQQVRITMLDGKVKVYPTSATSIQQPTIQGGVVIVELRKGQQADVRSDAKGPLPHVYEVERHELQRQISWSRGRLSFSGQSLSEVADELERYSPVRLSIVGRKIARFPVLYDFDIHALDIDGFLKGLSAQGISSRSTMSESGLRMITLYETPTSVGDKDVN